MEYTVKFDFSCMGNKGNKISLKSGEVDITSDATPSQLKKSNELITLIANDMAQKTKKNILNVEINEIVKTS